MVAIARWEDWRRRRHDGVGVLRERSPSPFRCRRRCRRRLDVAEEASGPFGRPYREGIVVLPFGCRPSPCGRQPTKASSPSESQEDCLLRYLAAALAVPVVAAFGLRP